MPQPIDLGTILNPGFDEWFVISDISEIPDGIVIKSGQNIINRATGDLILSDGINSWGSIKTGLKGTYAIGGGSARAITGPALPSLPSGTEYVWNKTDGNGTLLDIISGKVS